MQEEVTGKSVALIIDGAKMSEQVLEKALQKFLEAQKNKSPKYASSASPSRSISHSIQSLASHFPNTTPYCNSTVIAISHSSA